jgi:serine/threonine-protein kinase
MELCDGGSLAHRFAVGPIPPDELIPLVVAIAEGLAALHEAGIVHRDVKPHNVLLSGGRPKLADFGLARSADLTAMSGLTAVGTTVGTLAYLAPEALTGAVAGPPADVFGLAALTFEGLTGRRPRPADSIAAIVEARADPLPAVSRDARFRR